MRRTVALVVLAGLTFVLPTGIGSSSPTDAWIFLGIDEFRVDPEALCQIREAWVEKLLAEHPEGTWVPMKYELSDEDLQLMGLPSREVLTRQRFSEPTAVLPDGTMMTVALNPAVASYAGNGCLGIRPGAWLLLINGGSIGWCSMAHVYGSAGNYKISTAGHCGKSGDLATVIGGVGNFQRNFFGFTVSAPILIDFGKFSSSTDGGIGNDKAFIDVFSQYQHLVSPTMCFWAGPLGLFTSEGAIVAGETISGNSIDPSVTITPNPFLAQEIVHYGHGAGLGPGGTPRTGFAQHWDRSHFAFFGAITPGDSGSGANTVGGDAVGQVNEAAGIITHLYVDATLRTGIGLMAGTRASSVGTPALGQIVPYPVPAPGLP